MVSLDPWRNLLWKWDCNNLVCRVKRRNSKDCIQLMRPETWAWFLPSSVLKEWIWYPFIIFHSAAKGFISSAATSGERVLNFPILQDCGKSSMQLLYISKTCYGYAHRFRASTLRSENNARGFSSCLLVFVPWYFPDILELLLYLWTLQYSIWCSASPFFICSFLFIMVHHFQKYLLYIPFSIFFHRTYNSEGAAQAI